MLGLWVKKDEKFNGIKEDNGDLFFSLKKI